jgi:hypothetical protein
MAGGLARMLEMGYAYNILAESLKEKDHLEDLVVNGRILNGCQASRVKVVCVSLPLIPSWIVCEPSICTCSSSGPAFATCRSQGIPKT